MSKKHVIDPEELEEAQEAFKELKQNYEIVKHFLQCHKDHPGISYEYLRAYNFGHAEIALFEDHMYVTREESIEAILNELEAGSYEDPDDATCSICDKKISPAEILEYQTQNNADGSIPDCHDDCAEDEVKP